jgi:tetratricopeptide (TPR) repeat protein
MASTMAPLSASAASAKERGNNAFAAGQFDHAVTEYTEAIKLAPKSAPLFANCAAAYLQLDRLPEALQDAQTATSLDERWAKGWSRFGDVMLAIGEKETNPVGMKLIYQSVEESYENVTRLLENKGSGEAAVKLKNGE